MRPHFFLGGNATATPQQSVMVVDVPRPLRPDEEKFLPKEMIENRPPVPVYKVGDEIIVTGKWRVKSDLGFLRTDGLLQYASLEPKGAPVAPALPVPKH